MLEFKNHTLNMPKMAEMYTLFMTNSAKKNIPFGAAHTCIAHIRKYHPPPGGNAKRPNQ